MTIEKSVVIDEISYPVTISDEKETLLGAKAAGRVIVGLKDSQKDDEWLPADFVTELPVDETWLEGVVRREKGLPWLIAKTERLLVREFTCEDCAHILGDEDDSEDEAILKDESLLSGYINSQYAFFNCGMWAVVRQSDGQIVGMVCVTPEKEGTYALGYHIYLPFRRMGYAKEACLSVVNLLNERGFDVVAVTGSDNEASVKLLESMGFGTIAFCEGILYNDKHVYLKKSGRKVD